MAKRRAQPQRSEELPNLLESQCRWETFNATWAGVPSHVERQRRDMAQRLVEGRLPPGYIKGESSQGEIFNR
jgi:hypothetical protein